MSVVKPKPKLQLWPITKDVKKHNEPIRIRSNYISRALDEERNACKQGTIGFGLA